MTIGIRQNRYAISVNSDTQKWMLELVCQAIDRGTTVFQPFAKQHYEALYTPKDKELIRALRGEWELWYRLDYSSNADTPIVRGIWADLIGIGIAEIKIKYPSVGIQARRDIAMDALEKLTNEIVLTGEVFKPPHPRTYMNGAIRRKVNFLVQRQKERITPVSPSELAGFADIPDGDTDNGESKALLPWHLITVEGDKRSSKNDPTGEESEEKGKALDYYFRNLHPEPVFYDKPSSHPKPSKHWEDKDPYYRVLRKFRVPGKYNLEGIFLNERGRQKYNETLELIREIPNPRHREWVKYYLHGYAKAEIAKLFEADKSTVSRGINKWLALWAWDKIEIERRKAILKTHRLSDKYIDWQGTGTDNKELYRMVMNDPLTQRLLLGSGLKEEYALSLERICELFFQGWNQAIEDFINWKEAYMR